jgi:hypothetical protein
MTFGRPAVTIVVLGLAASALAGCTASTTKDAVTDVSCSNGSAVITASHKSFRVADQCKIVVVQGNDLTIRTGSVGQLQVQGNGSTIRSNTVDALTLSGQSNVISGSRITSIIVSGNKNRISSISAGQAATINGNDNTVKTGGSPTIQDNGTGNDIAPK